jgi:hypothetical protein
LKSEKIWTLWKKNKLKCKKIWKCEGGVGGAEEEEEEVSLGVIMTNTEIFHIFHIISLFNLLFFRIFHIF